MCHLTWKDCISFSIFQCHHPRTLERQSFSYQHQRNYSFVPLHQWLTITTQFSLLCVHLDHSFGFAFCFFPGVFGALSFLCPLSHVIYWVDFPLLSPRSLHLHASVWTLVLQRATVLETHAVTYIRWTHSFLDPTSNFLFLLLILLKYLIKFVSKGIGE